MIHEPSPYEGTTPVASLAHAEGTVTLVEGQSFCLSGRKGDIVPDLPQGLFLLDTRMLSRWELLVDGHSLEPLTVDLSAPFSATFVGRAQPAPGRADAEVVVFRHRDIGAGMRERIQVTNHGLEPIFVTIELVCDVDFADLFAVKESRVRHRGRRGIEIDERRLRFTFDDAGVHRAVDVTASQPVRCEPDRICWELTLAPRVERELCVEVTATRGQERIEPRFGCGSTHAVPAPAVRLATWRAGLPHIETDHPGLAAAVRQAGEDLGALRIFDPEHPEVPIVAAGAPWFMTVFGRDSLLTAWMSLVADPSLAQGVLETLARFQGEDVDPTTEEEPGRILHEMRFSASGGMALGGGDIYYGSIDATPLFVMVLGELRRWDLADEVVDRLLPHADRALAWIEEFGDRDGDGYVEYERSSDRGLANQGWKDSWDSVRFADGRLAEAPIALCEVQAYVYAAYIARARFAQEAGDETTERRYLDKAAELKRRFNEDFWVDELGWYALGLDRDKRQIDTLTSNIGHCLWTGIVDPERAGLVAKRLMSPEMFSGWGIRTLATSMPSYNPVSYHNGSVWPHDNAICIAGLARYGMVEAANRVIRAQVDVATAFGHRLPELFAGFDRAHLATPAAYPASCSPQAWAAAAPLLWVRSILRLDPWAPGGTVWIDPVLPEWLGRLRVAGIEVAGRELTVEVDGDDVTVTGHSDLEIVHGPRPLQRL